MIKEVTYYDIICDRCGKSLTEESGLCYPDTASTIAPTATSWTRKRTNMYQRKEMSDDRARI